MSQRRILLIDSDPAFFRLLDEHLRRHGIAVDRDPDADALTRAAGAPPALLVIAVDEPDRMGFSLCNKAKKGPLAHVPVILATTTISPEGLANHRRVKLHADEYIDKRGLDPAELYAKVDRLLGLQSAADDEVELSIDGDEAVEIADSELILEESPADERPGPGSAGAPAEIATESLLLDAETDAAFAFLTGDEDASMNTNTGTPALQPADAEGADGADGADGASQAPRDPRVARAQDAVQAEADEVATAAVPTASARRQAVDEPAYDDREPAPPSRGAATLPPPLPPVPTDAALEETADLDLDAVSISPPTFRGAPLPPEARLDAALDAARRSISEPDPERARIAALPPTAVTAGPNEATSPAALAYVMEHLPSGGASIAPPSPAFDQSAIPEPIPARRRSSPRLSEASEDAPRRPRTNVDLGLDEIAERVDREQSGLIDRRAMHRAADLERENQQLRAELARARAAETGKTPIEREFFALREAMAGKERELTTLRDAMAVKERELSLERDRLRQLQHAKVTLETKNHELEARLLAESERGSTADATQRAAAAQVAALRQEIDARTQAVATAESARAAAERELAAERMARMAMAAKVEESMGAERASIEEYYRTELAAARASAAADRDAAVAAALAEAETEHDRAMAALTAAHRAELDEQRRAAEEAVTRAAAESRAVLAKEQGTVEAERAAETERKEREHAAAIAELEQRAKDELAGLRRQHAAEIERLAETHERALGAVSGEREHLFGAMDEVKAQHRAELEALRTEHAKALRSVEEHQTRIAEALRRELDGARQELADAREQAQAAIAEGQRLSAVLAKLRADTDLALTKARIDGEAAAAKAKVDGENAVAKAKTDADTALAKLRGEHAAALTKVRSEGEAALAKLRAEQDTTRAEGAATHQRELAAALQERDELRAGLTSAREQLRQLEAQVDLHQQELATHGAALESHASAVAARDQRIEELRAELGALEAENATYQEQVLKAFQKIKQDEAMVARAKKALAIAFSVLDDEKATP